MKHFTSPLSPLTAYWTESLEMIGGPALVKEEKIGLKTTNIFNNNLYMKLCGRFLTIDGERDLRLAYSDPWDDGLTNILAGIGLAH